MRKTLLSSALALAVAGAVALTVNVAQAQSGSSADATPTNPWGVTMVSFAPGTSRADMYAAVKADKGVVTTDLSKIGMLAVVSTDKNFRTAVKGNAVVRDAWFDKVIKVGEPDAADPAKTPAGSNDPQFGSPGTDSIPDPWHNATSFNGESNPEHILQWDDKRMNVPAAWSTTTGDRTVRVAVIDTGVDGSHKEIAANYDGQSSANTIPCSSLTAAFGPGLGQKDCSAADTEGHGTWVASRIVGAVNGFASNGIAPNAVVMGFKTLSTTLGGGLTSWIVDGMIRACDAGADLINMSLGGYDDPNLQGDRFDYAVWVLGVNYCRAKGTAIFASAGNEHIRINKTDMDFSDLGVPGVGMLHGVGQVANTDSVPSALPGGPAPDFKGFLETPAGVPGVIMVSATNNANGFGAPAQNTWVGTGKEGAIDQLTYYSSFGNRIDVAAPGGARKYNVPRIDGKAGDILYGGWGTLGALTANGEICQDPSLASPLTFACFKVTGAAFGWLQGTSMSSPNATGVAALALAAHPGLQGNPDALLALLQSTARTDMINYMVPNDPANTSGGCDTGNCHLAFGSPAIGFSDAYGAGIVDAAAAVA